MTGSRCGCGDEAEIRGLAAAFAEAANGRDCAAAAGMFTEGGVWSAPGLGDVEGRERITATLEEVLGSFDFLFQLLHQGMVEVDADRARARWYLSEVARDRKGKAWATTAVYDDLLVRRSVWQFSRRRLSFLTRTPMADEIRGYPFPPR